MARLLSWPNGLGVEVIEFLSGPLARGFSENTSVNDDTQNIASPFGGWTFQVSFPNIQGAMSRRHRGMITALHGGANAVRFTMPDGDRMTHAEAGMTDSEQTIAAGQLWSNNQPWSNDLRWETSRPMVGVSAAAALDATIIRLSSEFWGHSLQYGDFVGFSPFHLGMYMITESFGSGQYRIWPRLRKALTTDTKVTLSPTMAVRLMSPQAAKVQRDVEKAGSQTAIFTETFDYNVRSYLTE